MNVSRKLITVSNEGEAPRFFIVEGNPDQGYDLFVARVVHVGHHQRSWQAVEAANHCAELL